MIHDFVFYNPTKIYFGKDSLSNLSSELRNYGSNILLVYGKNAIKKIGLYDEVVAILKQEKKTVTELSGVMPNPTYEKLIEGVSLVRSKSIDLILAVGGGSCIDLAKGISASAYCKEEPFKKYWIEKKEVDNKVVPVASILTVAATGSEMNGGSVITNNSLRLKKGRVFGTNLYPKFSILNPLYTMSLSPYQTASGISDILSHLMEIYFSGEDENVSDYIIEGIMKCVIKASYAVMKNPHDYEARSNIMWASTMALNGICGLSKTQDWQVHSIEHQLSAYTDCAHGMGLSAIGYPYYKRIYKYGLPKFKCFAVNVFGIKDKGLLDEEVALKGLEALHAFFLDNGMATTLKELGTTKEMLPLIANSSDLGGGYHDLNRREILEILEEAFE